MYQNCSRRTRDNDCHRWAIIDSLHQNYLLDDEWSAYAEGLGWFAVRRLMSCRVTTSDLVIKCCWWQFYLVILLLAFFFFTILPNFTTEFCEWWSSVRYVENALLYKVNFYFYLPKRLQTLTIHHGLKSWIIWTILTNNSSASHALKLLPQTTEIYGRTLKLPTSKEDTHPTTMRTRHYCSEYIPRYALSSGLVRKIPFERRIFMERRISCRTNGAFID